ncbi:MAG TPA: gamma carbonic anhydrase family protein [Acidimicrobiales bacterium]|nr:gamma carbonic anhydrase family protein [Acidimicrobiales bacterium]
MPIYALGPLEPSIDATAYVHPDAVVIGSVTIGAQSSVWPCAVLRGDDGVIRIGARTSIQDGSVLHCAPGLPTVVGDECVIGHMVHLEGCTIEDGALVGNGSVVLHGAIVRRRSLVGSNAVVTNGMEVPTGMMALGIPAKLRPAGNDLDLMIGSPMHSYVARSTRYREELRRLD